MAFKYRAKDGPPTTQTLSICRSGFQPRFHFNLPFYLILPSFDELRMNGLGCPRLMWKYGRNVYERRFCATHCVHLMLPETHIKLLGFFGVGLTMRP
jgi:hypothetical protein